MRKLLGYVFMASVVLPLWAVLRDAGKGLVILVRREVTEQLAVPAIDYDPLD